ncbi:MAG: gliding motility-associated C-terminal domain-containing protein [Flavobacteriales bacterium]|nr:gliding motility-associated C-terminal domain-containing protein [Flavobacteriales bacterium]
MEGKDELTGLLQERFTGHELPVDPTVWEGVQAQLVEAAVDADLDLFQDRFNGHESTVDPGIWHHIAGQLGHGAAAGTTAGGGLLGGTGGWIAAGIMAVGLTGGIWWWNSTQEAAVVAVVQDPVEVPVQQQEPVQDPEEEPRSDAAGTTSASIAPSPVNKAGTKSVTPPAQDPVTDPGSPARQENEEDEEAPDAEEENDRHASIPATLEPRLNSTDTGTQDPRGLAVVERILGEAVNETTQHPRPEQEEVIPPPAIPLEEGTVEEPTDVTEPADMANDHELVLFIPNVFSPNNDLINDELRVQGEGFQEVRVRIYNANNNQLVFAAESLKPWDGRDLSGQPCQDGYYFYAIEAVDMTGRLHTKGQAIRLFR